MLPLKAMPLLLTVLTPFGMTSGVAAAAEAPVITRAPLIFAEYDPKKDEHKNSHGGGQQQQHGSQPQPSRHQPPQPPRAPQPHVSAPPPSHGPSNTQPFGQSGAHVQHSQGTPPDAAKSHGSGAAPGGAKLQGSVTAPGAAKLHGSVTAPGGAKLQGTVTAPGAAKLHGSVTAPGGAKLQGSVTAPGAAKLHGSATAPGGARLQGSVTAPADAAKLHGPGTVPDTVKLHGPGGASPDAAKLHGDQFKNHQQQQQVNRQNTIPHHELSAEEKRAKFERDAHAAGRTRLIEQQKLTATHEKSQAAVSARLRIQNERFGVIASQRHQEVDRHGQTIIKEPGNRTIVRAGRPCLHPAR